ncbi:hypothetical protein T484DRAFT_1976071 [Baffinella frigidus]|nr:hypothetical protein T484DRAFT_1976071 [Cryptophyta sp. CCMP2293]
MTTEVLREERRPWGDSSRSRSPSCETPSPTWEEGSREGSLLGWGDPSRRKRGSEESIDWAWGQPGVSTPLRVAKRRSLEGTEPFPLACDVDAQPRACDVAAQPRSFRCAALLPPPSLECAPDATSSPLSALHAMFDNFSLVALQKEDRATPRRRRIRRGAGADLLDLDTLRATHGGHSDAAMGESAEAPQPLGMLGLLPLTAEARLITDF